MTPTQAERRPATNGTGVLENNESDAPIVGHDADKRPRCVRCAHPLTAARSLARGMGPTCWGRTARGQLDARRDAVGRLLARLARRVASLDVEALAIVAASAGDVLDTLDALGGAR